MSGLISVRERPSGIATCTTLGGTPSCERVERRREAHVLAELVRARPEVAAVAGEAGAKLEEPGVLDHARLLEPIGDLRQARALRDRDPDLLAAVALERLEERVREPGDAEDDREENADRDEPPGPAAATSGSTAPATTPSAGGDRSAAVLAAGEAPRVGEPIAASVGETSGGAACRGGSSGTR